MGGVHGKISRSNSTSNIKPLYDIHDPRSPTMKRTPVSTPEDWRRPNRNRAITKEDPRSPGIERTPVCDPPVQFVDAPVTPLTLSYEDCKVSQDDPRSPMLLRTPLSHAQGIARYEDSVVACAPFSDDTVIVSDVKEPVETNELDETVSVSSPGLTNSPTLGVSSVTISDVAPAVEKEKEEERRVLVQSVQDGIEVPSSPLGSSAYKLGDSDNKVAHVENVSSPSLLADRKRKMTKQLIRVSPLKKSYSSPCIAENDENASPQNAVLRCATPTATRRTTPSSPIPARSTTPQKRTPGATRRSSNLKNVEGSPRSPLSPLVPRAQRNSENVVPAFNL